MLRSFHSILLSVNMYQAVYWATDCEGGCLFPGDVCMKTVLLVADVFREKHPDMRVPPMENPTCAAFEEYKEVPETVPID